jgi:hypothetical protein
LREYIESNSGSLENTLRFVIREELESYNKKRKS